LKSQISVARAKHTGILGLAGSGVCHAIGITADAVRSYRTFSPLPISNLKFEISNWLCIFCGTFPSRTYLHRH
jgi:hypothetical protein